MKVIIDIPEAIYLKAQENKETEQLLSFDDDLILQSALENGTAMSDFCFDETELNLVNTIDRIVQKAKDAANAKAEYMTMEEVFKEDCELKGEKNEQETSKEKIQGIC